MSLAPHSFAVCAMVRETVDVLDVFARSYAQSGAARIVLYYDGSETEAAPVEAAAPGGALALEEKQEHVFRHALERNREDWLLLCDSDEILQRGHLLGAALAALPEDVPGIRLRNTEAVWGTGHDIEPAFSSTYERHPFPWGKRRSALVAMLVYGRLWRQMRRGTAGHKLGKQLIRRGRTPDTVTNHFAIFDGVKTTFLDAYLEGPDLPYFRHYDAVSFARWSEKWRVWHSADTHAIRMSDARLEQMTVIRAGLGTEAARQAIRRYNQVGPWQRGVLSLLKLLDRIESSESNPPAPAPR
ncbi:hypothetical protein [Litorisediminicola beolgyonensis]|uniref:Glycosyl transferase family 2 n=1 Tax=Litorisediminicola beolgyonensis TaxID=1173614 RepID=A0ABW3ZL12_9RHOB